MSTKYHLFVDDSGSTSNVATYWKKVEEIYDKYHEISSDKLEIIMWGSDTQKVSSDQFCNYVRKQMGRNGGTSPKYVAKYIIDEKIQENIVLVTDGQVGNHDVEEADKFLNSYAIDNVICYIIGPQCQMNLSVTCPFTRENTSSVFVNETLQMSHRKSDYLQLKVIDTISYEDFIVKYDELESMLIAMNMGKEANISMHSKLCKLKKKLVKTVADILQSNTSTKSNVQLLTDSVRENNTEQAINYAMRIHNDYFNSEEGDLASQFDKKINYLISLCGDLRGAYTIKAIRQSKMKRAPVLDEVNVVEEAENNALPYNFECPILFTQDIPFIPILQNDSSHLPVLHSQIDEKIKKDIEMNPLRLLAYQDLVMDIASRLGHALGQNTCQLMDGDEYIYSKMDRDPYSRKPIVGYLALGSHTTHVHSSNYCIAKMITGEPRIIGNIHLYFAVIWYIILHTEMVSYLKTDISGPLNEHLKFRFTNNYTRACLSGNPQFILTSLPVDVSVWFIVCSGLLNPAPDRDALRLHIFSIEVLLQIMKVFQYRIPDKALQHIYRTQVLLNSLNLVKKNTTKLKNYIHALYQNAIYINTSNVTQKNDVLVDFIPIDGCPTQEQINQVLTSYFYAHHDSYKHVRLKELVGLASMVHQNQAASDVALSCDWTPSPLVHSTTTTTTTSAITATDNTTTVNVNSSESTPSTLPYVIDWPLYGYRTEFKAVEISPATLRPFYYVDKSAPTTNIITTNSYVDSTVHHNTSSERKRKGDDLNNNDVEDIYNTCPEQCTTWKQAAEEYYGFEATPNNLFSVHRAYLNYFLTHDVFPNYESFLIYCYNRYCIHATVNPRTTLPYGIKQLYDQVNNDYEPIRQLNLTLDEMKSRIKGSVEIKKRIKLER